MNARGKVGRGGKNCITFKAENTRAMLIDNFMHFGFQFHMRTLVRSRWLHRSNSGIPKATFSEPIPEHVVPSFIFSCSFATLLYAFTKFPLRSDGRAKFPGAIRRHKKKKKRKKKYVSRIVSPAAVNIFTADASRCGGINKLTVRCKSTTERDIRFIWRLPTDRFAGQHFSALIFP